jgi:hypothetical protein
MRVCALGDSDVLDRAMTRAQCLKHGRDSVETLARTLCVGCDALFLRDRLYVPALFGLAPLFGVRFANSSVGGVWLHASRSV